jgi:TRAP-type C4-dicarboxylate transport system permease small subunit
LFGLTAATGIFASQKMSVYALVIGAFVGIGIATATGSHLVPRVLFGVVPPSYSLIVNRFADLLTGLFLVGVSYFGFVFVESSFATDLRAPVLNWPVWPFQLAIPLGFISAAMRYFLFALWPDLRPIPPAVQE